MGIEVSLSPVSSTCDILIGYQYAAYNWFPEYLPHKGNCAVTPTVGIVGGVIISSYLFLFLDFFCKTYLPNAGSRNMAAGLHLGVQTRFKPGRAAPESLRIRVDESTSDCVFVAIRETDSSSRSSYAVRNHVVLAGSTIMRPGHASDHPSRHNI